MQQLMKVLIGYLSLKEDWRTVEDFHLGYEVSNTGRVRPVDSRGTDLADDYYLKLTAPVH